MFAENQPVVVLDTNTLVRALKNAASPSGRVVEACTERRIIILLSKAVLDEYRAVLFDEETGIKVATDAIEAVFDRLRFVGEYVQRVRPRFRFDRDPRDANGCLRLPE